MDVADTGREEEESMGSGGWWASLDFIPKRCVQIPYPPSLLQPGGSTEPEDRTRIHSVHSFIHSPIQQASFVSL